MADWVNGGTVENCYTSGKIENNVGNKFVGGLIGQCTWSTQVKGCGSDATVISTESNEDDVDTVGGLMVSGKTLRTARRLPIVGLAVLFPAIISIQL